VLKALLLDLDNTLLGNEMKRFMPRYFSLLEAHMSPLVEAGDFDFLPEMIAATRKIIANTRPELTNQQLFWTALTEQTNWDWEALEAEAHFDAFYQGTYHQLQEVTVFNPISAELIEWAFAQKLQVIIATNPLFSQRAIETRLAWAGVPVDKYPYTLVTHYGNMHAAKPSIAYYEEILAKIGRVAGETLMVGDDWRNDIEPAHALGMFTYWIAVDGVSPPQEEFRGASGSLAHLYHKLQDGWLM
jgi:FMN phosphatase YigB (HAD superfamily)